MAAIAGRQAAPSPIHIACATHLARIGWTKSMRPRCPLAAPHARSLCRRQAAELAAPPGAPGQARPEHRAARAGSAPSALDDAPRREQRLTLPAIAAHVAGQSSGTRGRHKPRVIRPPGPPGGPPPPRPPRPGRPGSVPGVATRRTLPPLQGTCRATLSQRDPARVIRLPPSADVRTPQRGDARSKCQRPSSNRCACDGTLCHASAVAQADADVRQI
jgi:hypothetical protein